VIVNHKANTGLRLLAVSSKGLPVKTPDNLSTNAYRQNGLLDVTTLQSCLDFSLVDTWTITFHENVDHLTKERKHASSNVLILARVAPPDARCAVLDTIYHKPNQ
jgi:hypothetical protein